MNRRVNIRDVLEKDRGKAIEALAGGVSISFDEPDEELLYELLTKIAIAIPTPYSFKIVFENDGDEVERAFCRNMLEEWGIENNLAKEENWEEPTDLKKLPKFRVVLRGEGSMAVITDYDPNHWIIRKFKKERGSLSEFWLFLVSLPNTMRHLGAKRFEYELDPLDYPDFFPKYYQEVFGS